MTADPEAPFIKNLMDMPVGQIELDRYLSIRY